MKHEHGRSLGVPAFDPSGRRVLAMDEAGDLIALDVSTGEVVVGAPRQPGHRLVAAGEGVVVTGGWEGPARVLSFPPPVPVATFAPYKALTGLALGPGPGMVTTCSFGPGVDVWRLDTGLHEAFLPAPGKRVAMVAASPRQLAWASDEDLAVTFGGLDGPLRQLDLPGEVKGLAFSPDGTVLAASWAHGARWFSEEGELLGEVTGTGLSDGWEQLSLSAEPHRLAACGFGHTLRAWELSSGRELLRWNPGLLTPGMSSWGCLDPTGRRAAHVCGRRLRVFSLPG